MPKKRKSNAGRKPKILTEEMQDRFLKAIRLGCPIKDACGCAGFSEAWFYDQKNKAAASPNLATSKKFSQFLERIKEVEGEATNRWLAMIEKAAMAGAVVYSRAMKISAKPDDFRASRTLGTVKKRMMT